MGVGEETVQTMLTGSKTIFLTLEKIISAMRTTSRELQSSNATPLHTTHNIQGEQSLQNLSSKNLALDSIPISNNDIDNVKAKLREFGVDFSVVKSKDENNFTLFFKGKDTAVISEALEQTAEHFDKELNKSEEKDKKPLNELKEQATEKAKAINKENEKNKAKDKAKHKEQEL